MSLRMNAESWMGFITKNLQNLPTALQRTSKTWDIIYHLIIEWYKILHFRWIKWLYGSSRNWGSEDLCTQHQRSRSPPCQRKHLQFNQYTRNHAEIELYYIIYSKLIWFHIIKEKLNKCLSGSREKAAPLQGRVENCASQDYSEHTPSILIHISFHVIQLMTTLLGLMLQHFLYSKASVVYNVLFISNDMNLNVTNGK